MTTDTMIPKEEGLDQTLSLVKEGYDFIGNRMRKYDTNIFQTRLLGQKAICITGEDAAKLFYDENLMQRKDVVPKRIEKSLFGEGGVQGLDDEQHKHRKAMFMSLMTKERLEVLDEFTKKQWEVFMAKWEKMAKINLLEETEKMLTVVACNWAGVPLTAKNLDQRAYDLRMMVDGFGAVFKRNIEAKQARKRAEKWISHYVRQVRTGNLYVDADTALYQISWHEDLNGKLLDTKTAAVEVLNILRPIVAIGRYITFSAAALHEHAGEREKVAADPDKYGRMFVQEVRRFYPFGPFLGNKTRKDFQWNGYHFPEGTMVLLDLYGTNHHPDIWEEPEQFRPERFEDWKGSPFDFIPQGGGDYSLGHRCAGEWITIQVMQTSLRYLAREMTYDVPAQDLSYSKVRIPSVVESRFQMENVKRV